MINNKTLKLLIKFIPTALNISNYSELALEINGNKTFYTYFFLFFIWILNK